MDGKYINSLKTILSDFICILKEPLYYLSLSRCMNGFNCLYETLLQSIIVKNVFPDKDALDWSKIADFLQMQYTRNNQDYTLYIVCARLIC